MKRRTKRIAMVVGVTALAGCLGSAPVEDPESAPRPRRSGSAMVIPGSQIRTGGIGLLEGLASRVSNMRVNRQSGGRCPSITLRGMRTLIGSTNPEVYVDGTPMIDTCVLDQIRAADVERVEVYPGGISGRPGYRTGANGLILIFLTGGQPAS